MMILKTANGGASSLEKKDAAPWLEVRGVEEDKAQFRDGCGLDADDNLPAPPRARIIGGARRSG